MTVHDKASEGSPFITLFILVVLLDLVLEQQILLLLQGCQVCRGDAHARVSLSVLESSQKRQGNVQSRLLVLGSGLLLLLLKGGIRGLTLFLVAICPLR